MEIEKRKNVTIIWVGEGSSTMYDTDSIPLFYCPCCGVACESILYKQLKSKISLITKQISIYYNCYLKGGWGDPRYIFLFTNFICKCNKRLRAFLYTYFSGKGEFPEDAREFFLSHVEFSSFEHIDGLFIRNDCQIILEKFFIRWSSIKETVLIAIPFIGNPFQDAKQQLKLWDKLLSYLDPENTLLVTRGKSLDQFKKAVYKEDNIDYNSLVQYELLNPIIKNAIRKSDFHAKFFAGISSEGVEVLVGSHNPHGGQFIENLHYKYYPYQDFLSKYLKRFKIFYFKQGKRSETDVLVINETQGNFEGKLDSYTSNSSDVIQKYIKIGH